MFSEPHRLSQEPSQDLTQLLPKELCTLIRARAVGIPPLSLPSQSEVVNAFLETVFEKLPGRFSPAQLISEIRKSALDDNIIDDLPDAVTEKARQHYLAIVQKVGHNADPSAFKQHWPANAEEVAAFANNYQWRRQEKYQALGREMEEVLRYIIPPELLTQLLPAPPQEAELAARMSAAQERSVMVYRFLTDTCGLRSRGGDGSYEFELYTPLNRNGLCSRPEAPLLLRVTLAYSAIHSVTLITPLGELLCFSGADSLSRKDTIDALRALKTGLQLKALELSPADRKCVAGYLGLEDPLLFRFGSDPSISAYFPAFPICPRIEPVADIMIPASGRQGHRGLIGGARERELFAALRFAAEFIEDVEHRSQCPIDPPLTQSIFASACRLYDDQRITAEQLLFSLGELPPAERQAARLALIARGSETIRAILEHDKVDYIPEKLAILYELWEQALPDDAIVAPDIEPFTYSREAKGLIACVNRDAIATLVTAIRAPSELGGQATTRIRTRAFDLLQSGNPYLAEAIINQLGSRTSPADQAILITALEVTHASLRGYEGAITGALDTVLYWEPSDEQHQALKRAALTDCLFCLDRSGAELSDDAALKVADAVAALAEHVRHAGFPSAVEGILRRCGWRAAAAITRIEEFVMSHSKSPMSELWQPTLFSLRRFLQSTPDGWKAYSRRRR